MNRKKMINRTDILKRLQEMEADSQASDKPFIAFIGRLPSGQYEVVEHYQKGKNQAVERTRSIVDSVEEYFSQEPSWTVIYGEDDLEDELKAIVNDDFSRVSIFEGENV